MADAPTCDFGTLLVASNLDKIYGEGDAATHALKDMSFTFCEGEFAAIIGQSGSGKSTLLNLLGLLDTPTGGSAIYHGTDTTKISTSSNAPRCAPSSSASSSSSTTCCPSSASTRTSRCRR